MDELSDQLEDTEWLRRGASADPLNYSTITPVPDSLGNLAGYNVIFPPYQVACYACGPVEVYVPRE
jgi:hypothetical protein